MRAALPLLALLAACSAPLTDEQARWEQRAEAVTITRDDWGIPHIRGRTDADAVFGMIYAQAEDDFKRVEHNYLLSMGRLAEAEGESEIWRDLRMKLFIDPADLQAGYASSPEWLRALMDAWADGLNYYLHTHPEVRPRVITRFEPWMALSFSEGSIGGDIERVSLRDLETFYGGRTAAASVTAQAPAGAPTAGLVAPAEPSGSNGIAIAPANTASGHAMLLINPHTSFFFRAELQMTSDEGLNAYGAVTWGQFFIYQGFNEKAGWMHTSSGVDNIDEYLEAVTERDGEASYRVGSEERPFAVRQVTVPFRTDTGMASRTFTVYRNHRGPVVRSEGDRWVTVRLMEEPVKALTQSYSRTRATDIQSFRETMELHTNSSNNTVFADASGNIAYFHANFVPKRDPEFDWSRPVDGTNPATEWQGVHAIDESPNVVNPPRGWIQNTNNAPWTAAGPDSPRKTAFPAYFETGTENPRGVHAIAVLDGRRGFTLDSLIAAAYDSHLPAFMDLIPALVAAWDRAAASEAGRRLADPVAELRNWNLRWDTASVATSLAVYYGDELWRRASALPDARERSPYELMATRISPALQLEALAAAVTTLEQDFGTWQTPWGAINRFQRLTDDIVHPFDDAGPSIPVGFTSARWGSLASFGARTWPGTKKMYGTSGNSFVAVVEFGDSVRARAITAGGQSGDPASRHFNDQAGRYATGALRPVYFYRSQLEGHVEREYRPGK